MADAYVDREFATEAFSYVLESGAEGSIHLDQVLEYNEGPTCLRDLLIYQLTIEAKGRVEKSGLSRRQLARCLEASVPQLYRILDTTNTRKSINQLICLLQVLHCSVDLRSPTGRRSPSPDTSHRPRDPSWWHLEPKALIAQSSAGSRCGNRPRLQNTQVTEI